MATLDFVACVKAITFLEKYLGAGTGYQVFEPFSFEPTDTIAANKAARTIAEFIGLGEYTFVVAFKRQKEGVGENIDLRHGEPGAFIEVDEDAVRFKGAVLATLCHEVTHKFLHIRDLYTIAESESQLDAEVLTDLAAVFLGLGKFMLLGSECRSVTVQQQHDGKVTTTHTYKSGYLSRSQFAMAYLVVCTMRRIPPRVYEARLTLEVLEEIQQCRRANSPFLDAGWYEQVEKNSGLAMSESLAKAVSSLQDRLAEMSRDLLFLQEFLKTIDSLGSQAHTKLHRLNQWLEDARDVGRHDPCFKYLDSVRRGHEAGPLAEDLADLASKTKSYYETTRGVSALIGFSLTEINAPPADLFRVVAYKVCGQKLRLPENCPVMTVECPKCRYRFRAITARPNYSAKFSLRRAMAEGMELGRSRVIWPFLKSASTSKISPRATLPSRILSVSGSLTRRWIARLCRRAP